MAEDMEVAFQKAMRSFACKSFVVAALLGFELACQSPAAADALVTFASAATTAAQVENRRDDAGLSRQVLAIQGYLTRPRGKGPFPAIVLLHSCLGLPADRRSTARRLADWGYVTLFVDDFTPRGLRETCTVNFPEGLADAFGALAFVANLPFVDRTRVAIVGYSQGAGTALDVASRGVDSAFAVPTGLHFKAVAAFYPPCENQMGARLRLPTLILIGAADNVTPAAACERLIGSQPAWVKLVVYPDAGHVFDDPEFAGGKRLLGMWLQFDQRAAAQSQSALRDFLAAKLR
jgi:dienelactone hydrolase